MPSFGRLSHLKHSNRSQHGLTVETPAADAAVAPSSASSPPSGSGPGPGLSSGASGQASGAAPQFPPHQIQHQQHYHQGTTPVADADSPANTASTPHSALSAASSTQAQAQAQAQAHHDFTTSASDSTPRPLHPPHSLSRNADNQRPLSQSQLLQIQSQKQQQQQPPPGRPLAARPQPQGPPPPPAQFYSTGSNPSDLQDSIGGGSPLYDTTRQQQQFQYHHSHDQDLSDPAANISRSQSQRYSTILPAPQHHHPLSTQHQHHLHHQFATSSSSLDDLPSTAAAHTQIPQQQQPPPQQQAPTQEKRSTRSRIKGIFSSSSSRAAAAQPDPANHPPTPPPHQQLPSQQAQQQQQQQQQQLQQQSSFQGHSPQNSYDNTAGLARRPSKRVSNSANPPPAINTTFKQHQRQQQQQYPSTDRNWQAQQQGSYSQLSSPLQDVGESEEYRRPDQSDSEQDPESGLGRNNTIRQVAQDPNAPGYRGSQFLDLRFDQEDTQRQQSLSHPQVQVHPEDEPQRYENNPYEPQQQQHPASFNQRVSQPAQPPQFAPSPIPQSGSQQFGENSQFGRLSPQGNSETVSQFSHESPVTDTDQRSSTQLDRPSPAVQYSNSSQEYLPSQTIPPGHPLHPQNQDLTVMPSGGAPANRRAQEVEKALRGQVEPPAGPPPGYRHPNTSANALSPLPPGAPLPGGPPNPAFRGDRPPQFEGQADQGRDSPQPTQQSSMALDAEGEKAFKDLLVKYKNVKRLYFDGKSQIEALSGQVETLQNAVANQRMSQSRTAWDDNEYSTRFNRLNGAINNLSFNIRKDWRSVPQWLNSYVSAEALKTGKQEMTAVGRAVISRWLMEEVFNKCFHPGLDPVLSAQLKEIELSIRGNSYTLHSQEEHDALTTKVVNWRMATLDGLQRKLNSNNTADNRTMFTTKATTNLTACLYQFLSNPPPAGVEGSTTMIVELAVAIAANIPLESRDIAITYPLPGDPITPHLMEVEKGGLPAVDGSKTESSEADADEDGDKTSKGKTGMWTHPGQGRPDGAALATEEIETDVKSVAAATAGKELGNVRFAGFVALEVRGRQVLMKAPVWPL
ncbi:S-adenosylmethionine-dependent methyltransferase-like protein [Sarocladium implicatum]|nr:S-adenosylmethionine-dependent methyltransferase-like protein [Sarocladium implicatum]